MNPQEICDDLSGQTQGRELLYNNIVNMDLKSYNKALCELCRKGFNFSFINEIDPSDEELFFCNDTDTVKYKLIAKKDRLTLYFYFVDLENVWRNIEAYFRATYYKNFSVKISKTGNEPALEISLDAEGFTILNKEFVPGQVSGITTGKGKFDPLIDALSKRLSSIKRHFLASSFEKMLDAVRANALEKGNRMEQNFSFYLKPDRKQKVWLAFEKNQFTVYYGLGFEDRFEQQLGKIFFSELIDAKKHIHNSPAVAVTQSELPKALIDSFPEEKTNKYNFTNGIISITLFGPLVKNHRSMATYLAGFRNYAYYHVQAWKCYLHARILRRLNIFQRDLQLAQIEPFAQN